MARFVISPHFRLHEWVAEEKGYFKAQGLDYEFRNVFESHATPDRVGAYTSFEKGREANISCACHWTVNVAASSGHGKLYADAYSVAPAAVFVPPESAIRDPADVKKYFRALRSAQRDIDLRPERYTRYYRREFPQRFLEQIDVRRWGPGERIVFEPYTKEVFEDAFRWVREHKIFEPAAMGAGCYEDACVSLDAH